MAAAPGSGGSGGAYGRRGGSGLLRGGSILSRLGQTGQRRFTPPTHVVAWDEALAQFIDSGSQPARLAR